MIYHYCNTQTFQSIINTKQVWLTDITKLNDTSEYKSGFDIIIDILHSKGLSDRPYFQEIIACKSKEDFQILIGCFSKEADSGSQWRLYADDSQGLSIGFDEDEIGQFNIFNRFMENEFQPISSSVKFRDVNYDASIFSRQASDFIDEMIINNPKLRNKLLAVGLRRLATIYKDQYFKDEREIRAIVEIEYDRNDNYVVDERVNAYKEKAAYHKLLTSYQDLSAIKEVIIGANCPFAQEDVESMLHEHGLKGVSVRHSSGRGRYRTVSK